MQALVAMNWKRSKPAKVDANQAPIVDRLRLMGASVQSLAAVGDGCPDLLIGTGGENFLMEVKNKEGRGSKLTEDQENWHTRWRGQKVVINTVEEAEAWLNSVRRSGL